MLIYVYEVATVVAIFIVASVSLNLVVARAGLMSLCHGAIIGVGAYAQAILTVDHGLSPLVALPISILIAAAMGAVLASVSVGLDEEQFAVTTLAFNLFMTNLIMNATGLTKGAYGIAQIPRPDLAGFGASQLSYLGICVGAAAAIYFLFKRLSSSGFGTLLFASAHDRPMTESIGANVIWLRVLAFTLGSAGAGLAGALFAMHWGYISPELFHLHLSILILAMVILGGAQTTRGAAVGAIILIVVPELLRFAAFDPVAAGPLRQLVFGFLIIAAVFVRYHRAARSRISTL
jgi:branched-chain amino acid transport system permease protein